MIKRILCNDSYTNRKLGKELGDTVQDAHAKAMEDVANTTLWRRENVARYILYFAYVNAFYEDGTFMYLFTGYSLSSDRIQMVKLYPEGNSQYAG